MEIKRDDPARRKASELGIIAITQVQSGRLAIGLANSGERVRELKARQRTNMNGMVKQFLIMMNC